MERDGLVARSRGATDRRKVTVSITPEGRCAVAGVLAGFPGSDATGIKDMLRGLIARYGEG